jgi:hypothetical protein
MARVTSGGLSFPAETFVRLRVSSNIFRQELQGDEATKLCILGLVHDTHPTTAQLLDDAVVRDGLADHSVDAWLSGRLILRMRHLLVNK